VRIGIGLPTSVPGRPDALVDWARRADAGPFTSLGVIDRLVYRSHDPFTALAAAAAVTQRLTLCTMIAIAPIRRTAVLAKQALSVHALSGGRLVLGVSLGARPDDYGRAGADWSTRGRTLSAQLADLRDEFEDHTLAPHGAPDDGPTLLVGGGSGPAFLRAARHADGYVHGGGPPRAFASAAAKARAAWADAGRPGEPLLWGQSYVALTDPGGGDAYLRDYYAFTGSFADRIAAGLLTTPIALRDHLRGYAEAGCGELVLLPATGNPAELDAVADVVAGTA
jgi:alkanesulfonate monooxygenase SsuD/methylene tetrahydromethanopterin reductase-like flavin-dependent oxidoreductase (luciferase family)